MKKKIFAMMLVAAMMTTSFAGCGTESSSEEADTNQETELKEEAVAISYNVKDYVTLGDFDGVEVTITGNYDVDDEAMEKYLEYAVQQAGLFEKDEASDTVEKDSIVNANYVGSQDGVPFDGGSADDVFLDIEANGDAATGTGYIEGFTAGLVGHKVGEEVAYEVTFPENYGSEKLAGQTVIFTFNINYIAKKVEADSLTDQIVKDNFGVDTVEEFMDQSRKYLEEDAENSKKSATRSAVLETVVNNATISGIPEDLLQARVDAYLKTLEKNYCSEGQSLEDYAASQGNDYNQIVSDVTESLRENIKQELVFEAIAMELGYEVEDDEFNDYVQGIVSSNNFTSVDDLYEMYALAGMSGEDYMKHVYLCNKAVDYCVDKAKVNVEAAAKETAEE